MVHGPFLIAHLLVTVLFELSGGGNIPLEACSTSDRDFKCPGTSEESRISLLELNISLLSSKYRDTNKL